LAFSNSRLRVIDKLLPARLMKYWIMRIPEPTPRGLTLFFAIVLAIVCAPFVNKIFRWIGRNRLYIANPFLRLSHRAPPLETTSVRLSAFKTGSRDDEKPSIGVPHECEPLCEERRNVPCGLWFAPLDVLRPSARFVCAFAPRSAPVAKVLSLTPRSGVRVSAPARWLLSGGEMPWVSVFDRLDRHALHSAESSRESHLFLAVEDRHRRDGPSIALSRSPVWWIERHACLP
jgi:hypothetical protein